MEIDQRHPASSKKLVWAGRIISALVVLVMLFSAAMKLSQSEEISKGFEHLGWPARLAVTLAIVEIVCTVLYIIPQTAVLGAILITGYLGGAIATHVRLGEPFIMPAVLGVLTWLALVFRDARLRSVLPIRKLG